MREMQQTVRGTAWSNCAEQEGALRVGDVTNPEHPISVQKIYLYFKTQSSIKGKIYEDNINMDFRDIQSDSKRWTQLNLSLFLSCFVWVCNSVC